MRIVFWGSGKIAVPSLKALKENGHEVLSVVTAPDARKGRYLAYSYTPIKEMALKEKLDILQPNDLSTKEFRESIKKLNADIFVVFSYGKIITKELLEIPNSFALNIHTSLLPKYRGAAPINWALINGEDKTGITIIKMNEKLDEGEIISQREIKIEYLDNAITLEEKLAILASNCLRETLIKIKNNEISMLKQDNSQASYAPKLKKEDGRIDWNKSAEEIRNKIRGCFFWPGAFTFYKENMLKIWDADILKLEKDSDYLPGTIVSSDKEGIDVATKYNSLLIKELQFSSGKRLSAWQFIQGHKIKTGERLT